MPEPLPPCEHPGCDEPGSHGINDFFNRGPTTPKASYWCAAHVPQPAPAVEEKPAPAKMAPQGTLL